MPDRHFASDNNAGAHPEILAALAAVNAGHVPGYGDDPYTRRAEAAFQSPAGRSKRGCSSASTAPAPTWSRWRRRCGRTRR